MDRIEIQTVTILQILFILSSVGWDKSPGFAR
jgi:hypothetical protein